MADYIVSVDAGNGGVNATLAQKDGKYKSTYFPSYRASTDGSTLNMPGGISVMQYEWVKWNGSKYIVGDTAMRMGANDVETHRGETRYGNEFHEFLVAYAVAQLGIKEGSIHLVLFCPPGLYAQVSEQMKKRFLKSTVEIQLSTDKKPRSWVYEKVSIYPEGVGAAACILLDAQGNPRNSDIMAGDFLVLDGGVQTMDVLLFNNGSLNPQTLRHATYKGQGLYKHVISPILTHFQQRYGYLNIGHVDSAIRQGLVTGEFVLNPDNLAIDIGDRLKYHCERYAEWVANTIIDGDFDKLDTVRAAYSIGGWDNLCGDLIRKWYPDKFIDPKKVDTLKKLDPVDVNAVGGLRLAIALANRQKA